MSGTFVATSAIKLVVWDMDDTFWRGTLSEGGISLIEANIEIVKTLAKRGIMSSISSKNDFDAVKTVLQNAGVWEYFIFPQISWNSKGSAISNLIQLVNLRPDNILFVDDNRLNLEEVLFLFPSIMVAHPDDALPTLLALEQTKGKDDSDLSRLQQYKKLEKKAEEKSNSNLSNEDFLRQCQIKIRFEFDVDSNIERIIELINRSNQLNFTKVRLDSDEKISAFREYLNRHDVFSAAIFAKDRYGDHGLIGFYMQVKTERSNRLVHFVWSCRLMHSGLEQYVYERLGRPAIDVVGPVANPIESFAKVDWIEEITADEDVSTSISDRKLLLIGSCDLTAVASYCSRNRAEYVNGVKKNVMTRFDDFGFILGDPTNIKSSSILEKIPAWEKKDFFNFQNDIGSSDILVLSLSAAMKGSYLLTNDGVVVRAHPEGLGNYIDVNPTTSFMKDCKVFSLDGEKKLSLLKAALSYIHEVAKSAEHKFLLGANTRVVAGAPTQEVLEILRAYNSVCQEFCANNKGWIFVSIDNVVAYDKLIDDRHYSRIGYFDIANYINQCVANEIDIEKQSEVIVPARLDVASFIRSGKRLSRVNLLGSQHGFVAQIKRVVKLTPLAAILRRTLFKPKVDPLLGPVVVDGGGRSSD